MIKKYKNPTIRVEWEDTPENFTQERKNRVKSYFQKKYDAKNVSVILKTKKVKKTDQDEIITDNLYDLNYQKKLIKEYVKTNAKDISAEFLDKLDNKVNEKLTSKKDITFKINECKIKNILFNNFLSYGENNALDFTKLSGLVTINGPMNNGNMVGKTTMLNAVVFLLFGTTFSTKKNEEIFNIYTNENEVKVSGVIEIDGDDYNLERVLTRKPKKKGSAEWSYSSVFNLYKLNPDGTEMNETEEQRRETEKSLKESIGDIEDFLLTIVATSNNLEDIIDSGATDRGKIFSKFMGLDILQEKSELCKTIYSEYQKGLKSNQYNIEELKTGIEENNDKIQKLKIDIGANQKDIDTIKNILTTLNIQKDYLLKDIIKIDPEVSKLNYSSLLNDKTFLENIIKEKTDQYDKLKSDITNLEHQYDEVKYNELLSKEKELLSLLSSYKSNLDSIKEENDRLNVRIKERDTIDLIIKNTEDIIREKKKRIVEHAFSQDTLDEFTSKLSDLYFARAHNNIDISSMSKLIKQLEEGEFCPTCKRKLEDIDHTDEINELKGKVSVLQKNNDDNFILITEMNGNIDTQKNEKQKMLDNENIVKDIEKLEGIILNNKTKLESITTDEKTLENNSIRIKKGETLITEKNKDLNVVVEDITYQKDQKLILDTKLNNEILLSRIELDLEKNKNKLNTNGNEIKLYEDNMANIENNKTIQTKINVIEFDINTNNDKLDMFNDTKRLNENTVILTETDTSDKNKIIAIILDEEKYIKTFDFYISMLGKNGIMKLILRDKIPYMNDRLFDLMSDLPYYVKVDISEKNEVQLFMVEKETSLEKFLYTGSGFERTMGALSLRQVLYEISALPKFSSLFLDEILGKVAENNFDKVEMFLDKIAHNYDNIFFISHNNLTKTWGDYSIEIIKENNISRILDIGVN